MSRSDDSEIPTSTDVMLQRTRRRAEQLRRRRRLVAGTAVAVVAAAIAVPLALADHRSSRVVNVIGRGTAPGSGRPSASTPGPATPHPSTPTTIAPGSTTVPATVPAVSAAPTTTAPSHPAPACATTDLEARVTGGNGAAGSVGYDLSLRNTGTRTCTLYGYPGVSYVTGGAATMVGAPARRDDVVPPVTVTLAPQHAAHALLIETDSLNYPTTTCRLTAVAGLRVYPPDQTASLFVAQATRACADTADPGLQIGPVEAAPSAGA